jgi:conjugative transposon TraJ protein
MNSSLKVILRMAPGILLPVLSQAQSGGTNDIQSLHQVLDQLYTDMLPLCSQLISVGRSLAGFAALWYIASRVWRHLANAEAIDFYPLFRPFVIGFAILIFPSVLNLINGVMQPTVVATGDMVKNSDQAIALLLKQKENAIKDTDPWKMYVGENGQGDRDRWYKYTHPEDKDGSGEGVLASIGNDIKFAMATATYNLRNTIKEWLAEVLEVLFQAAALCINTMRTFNLVVLSILGPLVFGLSVFDGFHYTLRHWLARYVNVFLWLPVANLFGAIIGKVQENMLKLDLSQLHSSGETFFSRTDTGYLVFMIMGIIGFFTVPSIANYIMMVGGGNVLGNRTTMFTSSVGAATMGVAGAADKKAAPGATILANAAGNLLGIHDGTSPASGHNKATGGSNQYEYDKLSGK